LASPAAIQREKGQKKPRHGAGFGALVTGEPRGNGGSFGYSPARENLLNRVTAIAAIFTRFSRSAPWGRGPFKKTPKPERLSTSSGFNGREKKGLSAATARPAQGGGGLPGKSERPGVSWQKKKQKKTHRSKPRGFFPEQKKNRARRRTKKKKRADAGAKLSSLPAVAPRRAHRPAMNGLRRGYSAHRPKTPEVFR